MSNIPEGNSVRAMHIENVRSKSRAALQFLKTEEGISTSALQLAKQLENLTAPVQSANISSEIDGRFVQFAKHWEKSVTLAKPLKNAGGMINSAEHPLKHMANEVALLQLSKSPAGMDSSVWHPEKVWVKVITFVEVLNRPSGIAANLAQPEKHWENVVTL